MKRVSVVELRELVAKAGLRYKQESENINMSYHHDYILIAKTKAEVYDTMLKALWGDKVLLKIDAQA